MPGERAAATENTNPDRLSRSQEQNLNKGRSRPSGKVASGKLQMPEIMRAGLAMTLLFWFFSRRRLRKEPLVRLALVSEGSCSMPYRHPYSRLEKVRMSMKQNQRYTTSADRCQADSDRWLTPVR